VFVGACASLQTTIPGTHVNTNFRCREDAHNNFVKKLQKNFEENQFLVVGKALKILFQKTVLPKPAFLVSRSHIVTSLSFYGNWSNGTFVYKT
jgi:hypothetical protein